MAYALHPYLNFPGTARAAMEFYREVFGGDLVVHTFGDFHALPDDSANLDEVMNAELTSAHVHLSASDVIEETPIEVVFGNATTLALTGDDEPALRAAFGRLAEDGEVIMPLDRQIWGGVYGSLTDRFGTSWQINISVPAEETAAGA